LNTDSFPSDYDVKLFYKDQS